MKTLALAFLLGNGQMPNSKMVAISILFSRFLIVVASFMVEYYLECELKNEETRR